MKKLIIEQFLDPENVDIEDSGCARIAHIESDDADECAFFRFQSWDEDCRHETFKQFVGKKVRMTIEVIEPEIINIDGRDILMTGKVTTPEEYQEYKEHPDSGPPWLCPHCDEIAVTAGWCELCDRNEES